MDQDPPMQGTQSGNIPQSNTTPANTAGTVSDTPQLPPVSPVQPATNITPAGSGAAPANTPIAPQKKRTGLIATIAVLIAVVVLGIVGAVWFFCIYNSPDKIAYDAVHNFLTAKNLTIDGQLYSEEKFSDGSTTRATVDIESGTNEGANSSKLSLSLSERDENGDKVNVADLDFGTVTMSDGVLYFKVDNILELVEAQLDMQDTGWNDMSESSRAGLELVYDILETIDGTWWQISFPDLLDQLSEYMDDEAEVESSKKLYSCAMDVTKRDIGGEISKLYGENKFIEIKKVDKTDLNELTARSGNSLYTVSFDYEAMADFINALPYTETATEAYNCYNNYIAETNRDSMEKVSAANFERVSASDLEEELDINGQFYMEISNFGHRLEGLVYDIKEEEVEGQIHLTFAYDRVEVSAPKDYRPITDLIDEVYDTVMQIVEQLYGSLYSSGIDLSEYGYIRLDGVFGPDDDIACDYYDYQADGETFYCWVDSIEDNPLDDEDFWT